MPQPWAFFEQSHPNNNNKTKMSSDMGSVPDLTSRHKDILKEKTEHMLQIIIYVRHRIRNC